MRLGSILVVALAALAAVAHAYGLQPGQCASRAFDLLSLLSPGDSPLWEFNFAEAGTVRLIISADVSSNVTVKLAVLNAQGREIRASWPSTRIVGTYVVDLEAPGTYRVVIKNPSSATARLTGFINITACGGPAVESWLWHYVGGPITKSLNNVITISVGLMGIVSYGVVKLDGRYFAYTLTTDAVKGVAYIPPDVSASGYWWRNATYYGRAFSVQLNAHVVARLIDGTVQYYSIRNIVGFDGKHEGLKVWNYVCNDTTWTSILDNSAVWGRGAAHGYHYYYRMPGTIPFGRVELETKAYAAGGKIIIEFYANGQKYDEVIIRPYVPATSAHIVIAPATMPNNEPLDLALIFAGYNATIPLTVLKRGQIRLELYVNMNGAWVPPPSAWSAGSACCRRLDFEYSIADVEPQGVGSAIVKPGPPSLAKLWAGTIIATPLGFNIITSTDLSSYASLNLGNGTRLVLTEAYVNGRPAQTLSNVPLGSIVVPQYKRQYLVSISAPGNRTAGWFDEGSTIVVDVPPVVDFGNGTRLVNPLINGTKPPLVVEVNRPMSFVGTYTKQYLVTYLGPTWRNQTWIDAGTPLVFNPPQIIDLGNNTRLVNPLINGARPPFVVVVNKPTGLSVEYTRQYLVSVSTPFNKTAVWIDAGASYTPPASAISRNGVTFVPAHLTIDGRRAPLAPVAVNAPLDITVHYNAYAEVPTAFLGLPALYAEASITCGGASNSTSGLLAYSLRLELIDAPAGKCSVSVHKSVPSLVLIVVVALVAAIVVLFRKRKRS